MAKTLADSQATYPKCKDNGLFPNSIEITDNYDILSYENGKFSYKSDVFDSYCFSWIVYVEKGEVKAFIYKTVDYTAPGMTFSKGK